MPWIVYILECSDKTLYTGITNDMENRLASHINGKGAKYTRGRAPYKIVYTELHNTKGGALKREAEIKSLGREQKLKLAGTMTNSGTILGTSTLRFERLLPCPIEQAWDYLTKPELLATWLAEAKVDLRWKGHIELCFDVDEVPERKEAGAVVHGDIHHCKPPVLLVYTWGVDYYSAGPIVTFKLEHHVGGARLVLFHRHLSSSLLIKCGAGWHTHLDILEARLRNEKPKPFLPLFRSLLPIYEQQFDKAEVTSKELQKGLPFIGTKLARNLVRIGITTEDELAKQEVDTLCEKMAKHGDFKSSPTAKRHLNVAIHFLRTGEWPMKKQRVPAGLNSNRQKM